MNMTESEAFDILAMSMREMRISKGGGAWRVDCVDDVVPNYGDTPDDAIKKAIKSKFGENLIKAAELKIKVMEMENAKLLSNLFASESDLLNKEPIKELFLNKMMRLQSEMIVCEICGNKRCPHTTDNSLKCTNSNDVGQVGSRYYTEPKKESQ
jgi:hypothetical protein